MKLKTLALLMTTHGLVGAFGFAAGIYALPILTAPPAPESAELAARSSQAVFTGMFRRDLADSDRLHWGEGELSVGPEYITLKGKLAPGPDYKLYLSPQFVETEADFNRLKGSMVRVGDVRTFDNFVVEVPDGVDPAHFTSAIVWCESFGEFITAATYRE
jgi:hypothetical protein